MIENKNYVEYIKRPMKLVGYQFVRLELAGVMVSKAKILVAPNNGKPIIGRDGLITRRYQKSSQNKEVSARKVTKSSSVIRHKNNVTFEEKCNPEEKLSPEI